MGRKETFHVLVCTSNGFLICSCHYDVAIFFLNLNLCFYLNSFLQRALIHVYGGFLHTQTRMCNDSKLFSFKVTRFSKIFCLNQYDQLYESGCGSNSFQHEIFICDGHICPVVMKITFKGSTNFNGLWYFSMLQTNASVEAYAVLTWTPFSCIVYVFVLMV